MLKRTPGPLADPIAVVGVSCRFPGGVRDLDSYWDLLASGRDAVSALPEDRFCLSRFYSPDKRQKGRSYTFAAGVIEDMRAFDPDFFGISRKEAAEMDPQQRLVLELVWEALEQGDIRPSSLRGSRTGVFIGVSNVDNSLQAPDDPAAMTAYAMTGSNLSIIANRVSWFFDLHGPSMILDAACAASLTAVHTACESLRAGSLKFAVAGGVNILMSPWPFIGFSKAGMLSPRGRCRVFDAGGDGYVRSEGAGVVLLKPLAEAVQDGNRILGLIAASGANACGRTTGIALPDADAQRLLLETVYAEAGLDRNHIVYVEAHGTGTAAGDPTEAKSIGETLGQALKGVRKLPVGSAKSVVGHLEPASGMAGLLKALLVLRHGKIPPNLHLDAPNPAIDFEALNISVPTCLTPLPKVRGAALVGVNSFGFGGANAHVALMRPEKRRSAAAPAARADSLPPLFLSAASPGALERAAGLHAAALKGASAADAYDLLATRALQRDHLQLRAAVTAGSVPQLVDTLNDLAARKAAQSAPCLPRSGQPGGVFVFSGNGGQWAGMGTAPAAADRNFFQGLEEVDAFLAPLQGWSVMDAFRSVGKPADHDRTERSQPLLFALQAAVVLALRAKGLAPAAVLGHSVGEVAAAWACGALSLQDACLIVHHRSRLQARTYAMGGMAAVACAADEARDLLRPLGGIGEVAAVNAHASCTVAADNAVLREFLDLCRTKRIAAKKLPFAYPFHTAFMDDLLDELSQSLGALRARAPKMPFFSTVTGSELQSPPDAAYWRRNIRKPVLFAAALETAADAGFRRFLEIGPSSLLVAYIRATFRKRRENAWTASSLLRDRDNPRALEDVWKKAWENGWELDLRKHFPFRHISRPLPAYPWEREYCWTEDTPESRRFLRAEALHPLLGWKLPGDAPVFENVLLPANFPWLADHVVGAKAIYPAAAFFESMLAAAAVLHPDREILELERVALLHPLPLADTAPKQVRLIVDAEDGGLLMEARAASGAEAWSALARCRIPGQARTAAAPEAGMPPLKGIAVEGEQLYRTARRFLLNYGPAFRTVAGVRRSPDNADELWVELNDPDPASARDMLLAPPLVDGALQSLVLLLGEARGLPLLPVSCERAILYRRGQAKFARARLERVAPMSVLASFRLLDASGRALADFSGCRFRRAFWLEPEHAAPRAHVQRFIRLPRPAAVAPPDLAAEGDAPELRPEALPEDERRGQGRKLLHLTTLACIRDCVAGGMEEGGAVRMRALRERRDQAREIVDKLPERTVDLWRALLENSPEMLPEAALLAHVFQESAKKRSGAAVVLPEQLKRDYFAASSCLRPVISAWARVLDRLLAGAADRVLNLLFVGAYAPDLVRRVLPRIGGTACRTTLAAADQAEAEALTMQFDTVPGLRVLPLDAGNPDPAVAGRFHVVILAWTLSEQPHIASVLEGCNALLAPGGLLHVLEHGAGIFPDYVFGTADGYWDGSGGVSAPAPAFQEKAFWEDCLKNAGFRDVACVGDASASFLSGRKSPDPSCPPSACAQAAPAQDAPAWLLIRDGAESAALAEALAAGLRDGGAGTVLLVDCAGPEAEARDWWRETLQKISGSVARLHAVWLAGYDTRQDRLAREHLDIALSGTSRLAAFLAARDAAPSDMRLSVVTGGAFGGGTRPQWPDFRPVPSQGAMLGFFRVLRNEFRGLNPRLIDLHGDSGAALARLADCLAEMTDPDGEEETVLAGGERLVPRLERFKAGADAAATLAFDSPGSLRDLYWKATDIPTPSDDRICVRVRHAGLNFRDVMFSLGLLPDEALENGFSGPSLGMECSGTVCAVGKSVTEFTVGDEVMCFAPAALATHVVTAAAAAARKPETLSFAEAAAVPVAFLTAWYSIKHLARAAKGERLLIHGAAGGVGLAAIQIAAHLGLEVYATAGTPEKRNFLRSLGVRHVFSSRSLTFADAVLRATNGEGVDMVLNSLSGEAVAAGLSTLRPFGRFLELGKRDFYADAPMRLRPFAANIAYFGIDLDQLLIRQPHTARELFAELAELFARRELAPPPHAVRPAHACADAFRAMQRSEHMGKLVIALEDAPAPERERAFSRLSLRPDAAYLISGGASGFGLAAARRLARRGAKTLICVSRSGIKDGEARKAAQDLAAAGVRLFDLTADVADETALQACLGGLPESLPPLRGVIHAAAVLDDGVIAGLTPERLRNSLAAKALGALNLHRLTRELPLDFFCCFSSATTLFGNPGQAGYVAANSLVETLAAFRRSAGLPATVIGWGPIADAGMLTRNPRARETLLKALGVSPTFSDDALDWMEHCLAEDIPESSYFGLDWRRRADLVALAPARFRRLRPHIPPQKEAAGLSLELLLGLSPEKRRETVEAALMEEISYALRLPHNKFSPDDALAGLGMDSLMGVELSLSIERKFGLSGYTVALSDKLTTRELARSVLAALAAPPEGGEEETRMIRTLEARHGVNLSGDDRARLGMRIREMS
jgi:acyl transferase domain-containing protein/NADPH:quinone reductase-like Zn-dependent oxidoreductase/acyl carrier protein